MPVTVTSAIFQGPVMRVAMRAADGTEIVAQVGADHAMGALRPGTSVYAVWDPAAARLLPR